VIQLPEGVDFGNGNIVHILIGIAAVDNEHLDILSKIAIYCSEEENVLKMVKATSKEEILSFFETIN
jgi:mannitol PTS system EIIA component